MDLVAEVDDTVVINDTEFGSTHSADEFKEELLKTNMIINRRSVSFKSDAS